MAATALLQTLARFTEVLAAQNDVVDTLAPGGAESGQRVPFPRRSWAISRKLEVGVADLDARTMAGPIRSPRRAPGRSFR